MELLQGMVVVGLWILGQVVGLLAQTSGILDPGLVSLVGNGATVIVLVWYVVYDVRVRSPAMLAAFTAEQNATRAAFADTKGAFEREQAAMRLAFSTELATIRAAYVAQHDALIARHDREIAEWRKMLFENMQSMRGAVHDVRDTAQVLLTKQAIAKTGEALNPTS